MPDERTGLQSKCPAEMTVSDVLAAFVLVSIRRRMP
jgi:hypothetical protein